MAQAGTTARWLFRGCAGVAFLALAGFAVGRLTDATGILLLLAKVAFLTSLLVAASLWIGIRVLGIPRTLRAATHLLLLALSVGGSLVVAEFALRAFLPDITTTAEGFSWWTTRWTKAHVHRNRLGFREREISGPEHLGVFRIAVIGDSFSFGQGIEETGRFSDRLERDLNGSLGGFQVLNFGRPGAETIDELGILDHDVLPVNPDFVLLQWYINDVEGHDKSGQPKAPSLVPSRTLREFLLQKSVLYYVLETQWKSLLERFGWVGSYEAYMVRRFADSTTSPSRQAAVALTEFVEDCQRHHIPVGILIFGQYQPDGTPVPSFGFLADRVDSFCSMAKIPCVDLRAPLAAGGQLDPNHTVWVNRFDGHPNGTANLIAEQELLKRFGPLWHQLDSIHGGIRGESKP